MTNEFPLPVARTVADLRATVRGWRKAGESVGFVPTMGALHEGHLSLIREAKARADRVVASVFVNPKQFAAHEDLGTYPRQEGRDAELLAAEGCDLLFLPSVEEMYPEGAVTSVSVGGPAEGLESDFRPHFFGGVATVVAKLLNQVQADVAVFGDKDYQQLLVVRQMARDLDIPTEIVGAPTARDDEGLALSSRNAYLSPEQRDRAVSLNLALAEAARRAAKGEPIARVEADAAAAILEAGFDKIDYVSIRRADDLKPFEGGVLRGPGRVLAAAWMGKTRLIDNLAV
ncbi:pantoate--beta-alanine ligase [Caulobacter sp. 17J80-11]|uniref:pantoate--beta-alanine ligase n=1 Tax=Caulobacter sp. 17J80-11 TaxID=2763502 RepID=UPI0016534BA2|nr:pantoate--beta-alanine ligase [Caulobacter sp. 17J80-11]MBC6982001.1 pantoate--beta-alanine ligase [Caulobacter sp. 17J80-11]